MTKTITASYSFWLLILGPLAFVTALGPWVDKHFPVVEPFIVAKQACDAGDCVVIEGWLEKRRDCKFVEVYARLMEPDATMPRVVEVEFMDRPHKQAVTRPQGTQFWGPWRINAHPGDTVSIHVTHQCHPFWDTKAMITSFEVEQ